MVNKDNNNNVEKLREKELRGLKEPITAGADGDIVLEQDFNEEIGPLQPDVPEPLREDPDPIGKIDAKERLNEINRLLGQFPAKEREIFELAVFDGRSKEDVAGMTNTSPEKVQQVVNKVKEFIAEHVQT
jgi:RNA polymerase sigma factor (sigma-70 family)